MLPRARAKLIISDFFFTPASLLPRSFFFLCGKTKQSFKILITCQIKKKISFAATHEWGKNVTKTKKKGKCQFCASPFRSLVGNLLRDYPNQQRALNKLLSELRGTKFVNKHRLTIQMCKKNVYAMCIYFNQALILHTTVGGLDC